MRRIWAGRKIGSRHSTVPGSSMTRSSNSTRSPRAHTGYAPGWRCSPTCQNTTLKRRSGNARKSVELAPNDDPSHWALGLVFFLLGYFDEAAAEFATTLRLNPHPYIWESGFHAVTLSATGHYKEAIAEIERESAAQPKNPFGLSFRGRIEAFAGNYANAARWFERAREADPVSSQSAVSLAQVYDRLGRVDDAISLLENGPPQWRNAPAVRFWLGLSYALAGRKEHAAAEFAAFRALAPKWARSSTQRYWPRYFTPEFADRIAALSREYGIPEK